MTLHATLAGCSDHPKTADIKEKTADTTAQVLRSNKDEIKHLQDLQAKYLHRLENYEAYLTDYKAQGFDTTSHERRRSLKESMPPHTPVGWDRANPEPPEVYTLLELEELIRQTERKMYDLEKVTTAGEDTLHHINPRNFSF